MDAESSPRILPSLWRYRWMSAAIVVGVVALAFLASIAIAPRHQARAVIGLRAPRAVNVLSPGVQGDASLARYTTQRARFLTSDAVLGTVAAELGRGDLTALRRDISVEPSSTSNIVTVTGEADTAVEAVALVSAVVAAYASETERYVDELTDAAIASIQANADELSQIIAGGDDSASSAAAAALGQLQLQITELETSRSLLGNGVEFVVAPQVDAVTAPGLPLREFALGLVIGSALAATAAWMRADRDRRITDPQRVARVLDAPFLGAITAGTGISAVRELGNLPQHDFRMIWTTLGGKVPSGVVVVESLGDDIAGLAAVNLAAAAAREELDVLIVDADIAAGRTSALLGHRLMGGGVSGLLTKEPQWRPEVARLSAGDQYEFTLLPAGPAVVEVDVPHQQVEAYVDQWRTTFDYVIVETQPLYDGQLAVRLASAADGLLLVVVSGVDERDLQEMRRLATLHGIDILGFVFSSTQRARR